MNILFDTMVLLKAYEDDLPEKWKRIWAQIQTGQYRLLVTEPLISELFYRIEKIDGKESAFSYIFRLKGMKSTKIVPEGNPDSLSFASADLRLKHRGLSLVDSFSLAAAQTQHAQLLTTDHHIRDAARKEKCKVDYLPLQAL